MLNLKCPKCKNSDIGVEGEWLVFCRDCGFMPNEQGYSTKSNAVRAFRKWKDALVQKGEGK